MVAKLSTRRRCQTSKQRSLSGLLLLFEQLPPKSGQRKAKPEVQAAAAVLLSSWFIIKARLLELKLRRALK